MPPRSHRASSAPIVPSSSGQNDRAHVDAGDICVGCIVWLPTKVLSNDNIKCSKLGCCGKDLDDDGYEHPVAVLSIKQRGGSRTPGDLICTVACITTFGDTSLSAYLTKRVRNRYYQSSIPISHQKANIIASNSVEIAELLLEDGFLRKQSYVKLQHTYEVPSSTLCLYGWNRRDRAYNLRLTEISYDLLMEKLGLPAEPYVATARIPRTRESRLAELARSGVRVARTRTEPVSSVPPPNFPSNARPYYNPYPSSYGSIPSSSVTPPSRVQPSRYSSGYRSPYDPPDEYDNDFVPLIVTVVACAGVGLLLWKLFW